MTNTGSPKEEYVISLHRYFIWANRMRTHFDRLLQEPEPRPDTWNIEVQLYMSYWYGGLYVVIEGWQDLGLKDATIDGLLTSSYVDLLRRYRNGAFHFQRDYFDERFMDFMKEGKGAVEWVRELNQQFGRFFLDWKPAGMSTP